MLDRVRVQIDITNEPWAASHTWTDVSNLSASEIEKRGVRSVNVDYGRERAAGGKFRERTCTVVFNNQDGDWDLHNSANSVFGSALKRNRIMRVLVSDDDFSTSEELFVGYIDDIVPSGTGHHSTATVIAQDLMRLLEEYDINDLVRPQEYTGERVVAILDAIGVPAGYRGTLENGTVLMPAATVSGSAVSLLQECARAEYGFFYVDPNNFGVVVFRERYAPLTVANWNTRLHSFTAAGSSTLSKIAYADVPRNLGFKKVSRVTSTRDGGDKTFEYDDTAANNPPITAGDGPFGLACAFDADAEVAAEAWFKGWDYDGERITSVDVQVYPDNPGALYGVAGRLWEPMTRVEVQLQPVGFTTDFNFEARIEQVSHRIGPDEWTATVYFSPYFTEWEGNSGNFYQYGTTMVAGDRLGI